MRMDSLKTRRLGRGAAIMVLAAGACLPAAADTAHNMKPVWAPDVYGGYSSSTVSVKFVKGFALPGNGAAVLGLPALQPDVLMAPHHGSKTANKSDLADWARPRLVVSCEGPPRGQLRGYEPYSDRDAIFLGTWPHGAVTVTSRPGSLVVETFQSRQLIVLRKD